MAIVKIPGGITPDNVGMWGLFGLMSNVNNYAESISGVTTTSTNTTLTAAQLLAGFTQLNSGAAGGYTVTFPSTAAILAALGPTVPTDGTYAQSIHLINNSGQSITNIVAGDASTTVSGTATLSTANVRKLILAVTSPTTITVTNVGSWGL